MEEQQTVEEMPAVYEGAAPAKPWTSWNNPVLTPEQWQEVRRAVEAGLGMSEAAKKWSVDYEAVKKRSQREEWLTESRIKLLAEKLAEKKSLEIEKSNESRSVPNRPEKASEAVAESLESHRSATLLGLAKTLKNAINSPSAQSIIPENVSELVQLGGLALKLYGVEASNAVQVNVITDGSAQFGEGDFPVFDVED